MAISIVKKSDIARRYRLLFWGGTYSGKTSGFESFEEEGACKFISLPGEKGTDSIPEGEWIESFIPQYEEEPGRTAHDSLKLSRELIDGIYTLTWDIINGKHGECNTLVFDGGFKWYEHFLNVASGGLYLTGQSFDGRRVYPPANTLYTNFISEMFYTEVPIISFTTWEKQVNPDDNPNKDSKGNPVANTEKNVRYPMLPGQMARQIIGEFNASIWCGFVDERNCDECNAWKKEGKVDKVIKGEHRIWQLNPKGDVEGCGVKGPRNKIYPTYIHQSWPKLKKLMER